MAARASREALRNIYRVAVNRCTWCVTLQRWRFGFTRLNSTLSAPQPDDSPKEFPDKIKNIVDEISKLTLVEVADLNELLKSTLKIENATMMPMVGAMPFAAAPAPAQEEEAEAVKEEPTEFNVKLTKFEEGSKVKLIKEIKNLIPGLNLVQAKKFVEDLPQNVKEKASKEEAEAMKKTLEAVGGTVEIET